MEITTSFNWEILDNSNKCIIFALSKEKRYESI